MPPPLVGTWAAPKPDPDAIQPAGAVPPPQICVPVFEPDRPFDPPPPLENRDSFVSVQPRLPEEANSGMGNSTYWLTGDEPVLIELEVLAGSRFEGPVGYDVVAFVDGWQVAPRMNGIEAMRYGFVLSSVGDRTNVLLELGPDLVGRGNHLVSVAIIDRIGLSRGLGLTLVSIRDQSCWIDEPRYLAVETGRYEDEGGFLMLENPQTGLSLMSPPTRDVELRAGEALEVEMLYAPPGLFPVERSYLVALVDGEQVPFVEGIAPALQAKLGELTKASLSIPPEFFGPEGSIVDLFLLKGVHQLSEDADGNRLEGVYNEAERIGHFRVIPTQQ